MKHIYRQMTTGEMSTHPTTASIDKSLYLMDNLEMEVKMSEKEKQSFLNAPIQYISTMSLLVCIKGAAKVNIGLEANEMHNHDALFLKSGIICEMTDMSPDTQFFSVILDEAFYYFVHFESDNADCPNEMEMQLRIMDNVLRYLVVKKDEE